MIDVKALNQTTDLADLVGHDTTLHKVTAGGEMAGPCPLCGGTDRFHVGAGWWFCRQCHPQRGDAVGYVQWRDAVGFRDACATLGAVESPQMQGGRPVRQQGAHGREMSKGGFTRLPKEPQERGKAWAERADGFTTFCQGELAKGGKPLEYLLGRGLTMQTILGARLGYNPRDMKDAGPRWGFGDSERVWLPRGWVIPCYEGGALAYVKVRRASGKPKYVAVKGSHKRGVIYGLDDLPQDVGDVILVEGEYNALILRQALCGIAGVVSVGDAGNRPGPTALARLVTIPRWWALYDPDPAGQRGAAILGELSSRVQPIPWPKAWRDPSNPKRDLNDAAMAGQSLAARVIPSLGPKPTARDYVARRGAWLIERMGALDQRASDAGPDGRDPALLAWLYLLREYNRWIRAHPETIQDAEKGRESQVLGGSEGINDAPDRPKVPTFTLLVH